LLIYLLAPLRTNILLLGIDYTPPENAVGRSDTIILSTVIPFEPYVGTLAIPRDLWVSVPGVGENRINTAHFFAEGQQAGAGPRAAMDTIQQNFGVQMDYFVRIRFDGFRSVVNAMDGVDIELSQPMAGYPAGPHHLTGNKALAFARNRLGSDDFFRMKQGQLLIKSIFRQLLHPRMWPRLPAVLVAFSQNVDTNVPWFIWPRLSLALLRAGPDGIDSRAIERDMVTPFTTDQGASVLIPDWLKINPVLAEMFGE
jgi:LCP family protein required for cell wall assembly